jgi:hypothetical protein
MGEQFNWKRKDDCWVLLRADRIQSLQVTQLKQYKNIILLVASDDYKTFYVKCYYNHCVCSIMLLK